jgi:hypothetical protein
MPPLEELEYWSEEVSIAFAELSRPQAEVLALYSYGMSLTKQSGQSVVSVFLAMLLGLKVGNLRQRFRELTYEREQKQGEKRCELEVKSLFAPLLSWVLKQWSDKRQVVLGVDVTYLKDRYTILCISVLYRQTAIPVAWKVLQGNPKGEWHPLWDELLASLAPAVPKNAQVLVLLDSGLYSKRLFEVIRQQHWHPFMRIREQGYYKRPTSKHWQPLNQLAYRGMEPLAFNVHCFKGDPLEAVLWVQWDQKHNQACLVLSDLAPRQVKGDPYPLRSWIEAGFKDFKRGALQWQHSKILLAPRMERLILVMTLALFHLIRLGSTGLDEVLLPSDPTLRLSVVTLGWLRLLAFTIRHLPLTERFFLPYRLPAFYPSQKTYP